MTMTPSQYRLKAERIGQIIAELNSMEVPREGFYLTQICDAARQLTLLQENLMLDAYTAEAQAQTDRYYKREFCVVHGGLS